MRTRIHRYRHMGGHILGGILLVLLTACGNIPGTHSGASSPTPTRSAPTAAASPNPTAAPTSTSGATTGSPSSGVPVRTLTLASEGQTERFTVGQTFVLQLTAGQGFTDWEIAPPDAAILKLIPNPAASAATGVTMRTYQAVGPGSATIAASSRPVCNPGQACSQLIRGFKVTIIVTAT